MISINRMVVALVTGMGVVSLMIGLGLGGVGGCGGGSGGSGGGSSGLHACSYEERMDGCDSGGFSAWEERCEEFDADDYTITAEEVCNNLTEGGNFCQAGCCIDTEFRNVELTEGSCP